MRYLSICGLVILMGLYLTSSLYGETNDSSSSNTTQSSNQNSDLQKEMDKKTKDALKVFKNLKFTDKSKQDFFDTVGQSPSESDFEGGSFGDPKVDQEQFKIENSSDKGMLGR